MSVRKANQIIFEDNDYDEEGSLKVERRDKYEDKHAGVDYLSENENYSDDE